MGVIRKIRRSFRRDGFRKTLVLCVRNVFTVHTKNDARSQFDLDYGVTTDGIVQLGDLKIDSPSDVWGIQYAPTPTFFLQKVMGLLPAPENYSFVDLGSGKGRVVLMAAQKPFRSVTGVEFSPELCTVAEANLAIFRPQVLARDVRIVCQDAALFKFPPGPLIVYFYYAFTKEVLSRVLVNLSHREDDTIFVYCNVHHAELFAEFELMHKDDELCIWKMQEAPKAKQ